MTDKPRTYAKPKESGGISFKKANGNHLSVALKKTQKWKCVFNDEIGKYILTEDKWEGTSYIGYEVFWHDNECCDNHIGWQMDRQHPQGNLAGTINLIRKFQPKYVSKMIVIGNIYDNPELLKGVIK